MLETLKLILSQPFMQRAVICGIFISLCSALLGVTLVLKRYSMIGDGLSHVGFGAVVVAAALNVAPLYVAIPVVILSAFLLLRIGDNGKIKSDAQVALVSTGALAVAVIVSSVTTGMNQDFNSYMFGTILGLSDADVVLSVAVSLLVVLLFVLFYNKIFAVTFDENFSRASGVKTNLFNGLVAILTSLVIVLGMRLMGALLISSLMIFPALTSMRLCKTFKRVVITSGVVSVVCFSMGVCASALFNLPTGASIVLSNVAAFLIFSLVKLVVKK